MSCHWPGSNVAGHITREYIWIRVRYCRSNIEYMSSQAPNTHIYLKVANKAIGQYICENTQNQKYTHR